MVELAIGRYPIPPPDINELKMIFGANSFSGGHHEAGGGAPPRSPKSMMADQTSSSSQSSKTFSIFDLLNYIVNETPPSIPASVFSPDFKVSPLIYLLLLINLILYYLSGIRRYLFEEESSRSIQLDNSSGESSSCCHPEYVRYFLSLLSGPSVH